MIAKINDLSISPDDVGAMTKKEYKNFENRLRSLANNQELKITKKNHLTLGVQYWAADENNLLKTPEIGFDVLELRDWLYAEKDEQITDNSELDTLIVDLSKTLYESVKLELKYAKMRNNHNLLKQVLKNIQEVMDETKKNKEGVEGTNSMKDIEDLMIAHKHMLKDGQYFLENSNEEDKSTIGVIPFLEVG